MFLSNCGFAVFGWINGSVFSGDEQGPSYNLLVGNIKGALGRPLSLSVEDTTISAGTETTFVCSFVAVLVVSRHVKSHALF